MDGEVFPVTVFEISRLWLWSPVFEIEMERDEFMVAVAWGVAADPVFKVVRDGGADCCDIN